MPKRRIRSQLLNVDAARATVEDRIAKRRPRWTSLRVSPDVAERVRDAAHWTRETVIAITERAILAEVERLEGERGSPFEPRPGRR